MHSSDFDDDLRLPPTLRAVLLDRVTHRAAQIRRRRRASRWAAAGSAVVVAVVAFSRLTLPTPGTTLASQGGATETTTDDSGSDRFTRFGRLEIDGEQAGPTPSTPSTTTASVPSATVAPAQAPPAPSTSVAGVTTTTALLCRNSTDPACGPFRWDPNPPPNRQLHVVVTMSPGEPVVGETVTFRVEASDPDARIAPSDRWHVRFGDEGHAQAHAAALAAGCSAYGPWDPPAPQPSETTAELSHVYGSEGEFNALFVVWSESDAPDCTPDPYASTTRVEVPVTVTEAPPG